MNIEIAPKEYRIECSYNEALLYCFQLEIDGKRGWQLPTWFEYCNDVRIDAFAWQIGGEQIVIPVRDLI
jgi:hypothetical protein